ncbi:hypothetical protein BS47DRAFT_141578 [Hydnum rufescens UP504]|uniref:Uncharacterized protein n=1 Tax=Hydnum rufescens UP504 TaxID=1448309 RepID=A0A9P6APK2_9AGAM|nr:hypothetical protein BS47DRAFT_141578 [Hydnum rufescens UP504]
MCGKLTLHSTRATHFRERLRALHRLIEWPDFSLTTTLVDLVWRAEDAFRLAPLHAHFILPPSIPNHTILALTTLIPHDHSRVSARGTPGRQTLKEVPLEWYANHTLAELMVSKNPHGAPKVLCTDPNTQAFILCLAPICEGSTVMLPFSHMLQWGHSCSGNWVWYGFCTDDHDEIHREGLTNPSGVTIHPDDYMGDSLRLVSHFSASY